MQLKDYQLRVIGEIERYLVRLAEERASGNPRFASQAAWEDLRLGRYLSHKNGLGEDLPHFCIKVPTGGGKTLIATQVLGLIYRTILKQRNGAGLVLWVVPSNQIYRDTLRRLRDRNDLYRLMLEHALSRRIELWEKHEIARLTPAKLRECLNILVVQLASTNRETREQLKFFRDSGGNIVQHFPPEDDAEANKRLKEQFANLDMIEDDHAAGRHLVATSIGNLVRICKPPVILDEGHKATSQLARDTIENFNASIVVELSATPRKETNIICRVSGQELLDEEMIKLPLNIATSGQKSWKDALTQARDKRAALAQKAIQHFSQSRKAGPIRPIVLVQVERTGNDQRGARVAGRRVVHSEDVTEYLAQRLDVPAAAIAVKSATKDDIEKEDLLDPDCRIEWIITKSALQEGWDCPFAYVLVSLNNTGSDQSMTQLIGRVLRQPYQERTPFSELNESYVFCLHKRAGTIAAEVKTALEKEGYEGDVASMIVDASQGPAGTYKRTIRIREDFSSLYQRTFDGKIYLPRFCVRNGSGYEALDYFRHLVAKVDVQAFEYDKIDWPLDQAMKDAKDRFYRITLGDSELEKRYETEADLIETDGQVLGWLTAALPFDYLSFKQLRVIVHRVFERLCKCELSCMVRERLGLVKFVVRDRIERFIQDQVDSQTHKAFDNLYKQGRLRFYLHCKQCRFQIPDCITINATKRLTHDDGDQIKKSLFDYVEHESHNEYERAVALVLDRDAHVLWWYRNLVGPDHFDIQGYHRHKIRPDFVVQSGTRQRPEHRVIVIESKGKHLQGNLDTNYKRTVADYFEKVGRKVTWQQLGQDFQPHVFRFQILDEAQEHGRDWQDELRDILANSP